MLNHEVQRVGHTALTSDPTVYQLVRQQLDESSAVWKERLAR
jgi:hypothetical protein